MTMRYPRVVHVVRVVSEVRKPYAHNLHKQPLDAVKYVKVASTIAWRIQALYLTVIRI
jgi:hypothetical protein